MSTVDPIIDVETLLFFEKQPSALSIYACFAERLYEQFPDTKRRVQKTQITFSNRYVFACISFLRAKRKADLPDPYLVVTLGLPFPLESERVAVKSEPYPGRWTTHIVIGSMSEIDDELFDWVRQAYAFSERKRYEKRATAE